MIYCRNQFEGINYVTFHWMTCSKMNTPSKSPVFLRKRCLDRCVAVQMSGLGKRSQVSLTFGTYENHCLIRFNISHKYYDFGLNSYRKMNILRFSPYKCIRNQIWPCHKVGQGQPRFIIYANLVGPTSPMLHTKSQSQWPFRPGSRRSFKEFLPYMGMMAIILMWP